MVNRHIAGQAKAYWWMNARQNEWPLHAR